MYKWVIRFKVHFDGRTQGFPAEFCPKDHTAFTTTASCRNASVCDLIQATFLCVLMAHQRHHSKAAVWGTLSHLRARLSVFTASNT